MKRSAYFVTGLVAAALVAGVAARRQQPAPADAGLDAATRTRVIDGAIDHMRRAYIFADVAEQMAAALKGHEARRAYDDVGSPREFAEMLTRHLQDVSHDKHLRILYAPDGLPSFSAPTAEERERQLDDARRRNFGFNKVERLDGNVGYIELLGFSGAAEAVEAAVPAMNFVANADALIFDLRRNGGGSPVTIGLISSYLFDDVVHLNDFYVRETDSRQQFFTMADVQGRRYGASKPVYILTSRDTFSAAEEFTYNLKHLKRATVVGETTGGGAHPGGVRRITDHFGIWLPTGRAINPITNTNWEGVGIEPDIVVDSARALDAAHLDALKKVRATTTDQRHREQLDSAIGVLEKRAGASAPDEAEPDWTTPLNPSTAYLPRWSPDGRQLVFYRRLPEGWRIFTIAADGSALRQVTAGPDNAYQPAWSPDGEWIAFDADRQGSRDVVLLRLADGEIRNVTEARSRDTMPAWSPDGREIAFVSDREDGLQIWIGARDGASPRRVSRGLPPGYILRPAWSPDGSRLAFAASDEGNGNRRRLYVMNRDGSGLRAVTPPGDAANPSWAPDSRRLVFDATPEGLDDSSRGQFELFVVNSDGSGLRRLTDNGLNEWGPSWSPDGEEIAFCRGLNDQYEIYRMRADGTQARRVTRLVYR